MRRKLTSQRFQTCGYSRATIPSATAIRRLCDEIAVTGCEYAHDVYEADGWTTHHSTDLWRWVAPTASPRYGMWPTGGTWLAMHIWYHWHYARDRDVLARHYPTLKGAADFLVSYMTRDPNTGKLTVCPSMSPENIAKPYKRAVMPSNAIDHQLARDMLSAVAEATEILGGDKAYAEKLRPGPNAGPRPVVRFKGRAVD